MNSIVDFGSILSPEQLSQYWTIIRQWVLQNILVWENLVQLFIQIGVLLAIRLLGTLFGRRIRTFFEPRMKKDQISRIRGQLFAQTGLSHPPLAQHRSPVVDHLGIPTVRLSVISDAAHPEPFDRLAGHPAGDLGDSGPVLVQADRRRRLDRGRPEYRRTARRRHGHAGKDRVFHGRGQTQPARPSPKRSSSS